ncbi:aldose epimerase family protein [Phytohalomonas tamaricis]|uniref:aldose epimerase family protein n=1 Tax=Phytohalomonas tamaricis TaxID=2081032 RepID=UPI0021D3FE3E|nr:aldose epimerase family protein [Phytohalomonas tamaricis]
MSLTSKLATPLLGLWLMSPLGAVAHAATVDHAPFGKMPNGAQVEKYTLTNSHGMKVGIITYGGVVQSIEVPDKDGELADVVLGFDNLEGYLENGDPHFGALIGRYANRIAGGSFELDGQRYQIPTNDGDNALHGGPEGFDRQLWHAHSLKGNDWAGVELSYLSRDGEMGFPGDLAVTVRYTLNENNELRVHYSALSNKPTVVNLTNHSYFNLSGAGNGTVLDHEMMISASRYTPVNKNLIPTGELASIEGTPFDFRQPTPIGARIRNDNPQLNRAEPEQGGYDHNWVLDNPGQLMALAARVTDPHSGRQLELYTTQPGLQFYSSNFLDGSIKGKQGRSYQHWGAFALETQHFPDSPNQPKFPSTRLEPGEPYSQTTIFKFLPL